VLESRGVRLQACLLGLLGIIGLCVHCTPDLDKLTSTYGQAGSGGTAGFDEPGGNGGSGESGGAEGGTAGAAGAAGEGGGQAGSNEAGEGGAPEGGKGGTGGTGGRGGTGGSGGVLAVCPGDGCALLTIPADTAKPAPAVGYQQFVTINLDIAAGVDLSDSVISAKVRAIDFKGTTETVQLYASALPSFNFFGNNGITASLSSLANGGTLTMDLTSTGTWDAKHAISFGLLFHGGSSLSLVKLLVEDITVAIKADSTPNPKYGPWLFKKQSDVNESVVDKIPGDYNTPNVIFPNAYQAVPGTQALWVAPSQ